MIPVNPRAIFLDLDGTLADSLSVMRLAYQLFLKQFQCRPTDIEFDSLNGPPLMEVVRRLKLAHDLKKDENTLLLNYFDIIDRIYADVKPSNGAADLLLNARDHRCIIGVVTSNTRGRTKKWLEKVHLSHMIDFIVSGEEVIRGKPHPEPYLIALKKSLCDPAKIVVVEDSLQGAQSAVDAGLKTFVINNATAKHSWPQGVKLISSLVETAEQLFISKSNEGGACTE